MDVDPVVGSWLVEVAFSATRGELPPEVRGKVEVCTFTFMPGGGLVVSGPFSHTAAGTWNREPDGCYRFTFAELFYASPPPAVTRVVVPSAQFKLEGGRLRVIRGVTHGAAYDPESGRRVKEFEIRYDAADDDPPERVTGRRIGLHFTPPSEIRALPPT